jgi:hypothetical protein
MVALMAGLLPGEALAGKVHGWACLLVVRPAAPFHPADGEDPEEVQHDSRIMWYK